MINPSDIKPRSQFLTRDGRVATIEGNTTDINYPWRGTANGIQLTRANGGASWKNNDYSVNDLISLHRPAKDMNTDKTYYTRVTNPELRKFVFDYASKRGFPTSMESSIRDAFGLLGGKLDSSHASHWERKGAHEVTLTEFLTLFDKPKSIQVKLNEQCAALVFENEFKVGCQSFPYSKIEEIVAAHDKITGGQA